MEVAILGTKGVPGNHGVEVVVDSLLPHFTELGIHVTVYGYESYTHDMDVYKGARIIGVNGGRKKNTEMISHMWLSSLKTRHTNFDIVHIHSADPCILSWLPRSRYGVIATSHGQAYLRKKWSLPAKLISRAAEVFYAYVPKVITSVSKPLAIQYFKRYHRSVHYIPNGLKPLSVPSERYLKRFNLQAKSFLFCSAGRIEKTKGIHTLIEAYARMSLSMPLIIAGGGRGSDSSYFESLKRIAPQNVHFLGFLTGEELFSLYAYAAAFIFPSEYEAMSMALLEGLSFGTPTVYSDIPENNEVASGIAFPFPVGDAIVLADRIKWVLGNSEIAKDAGRRAKEHIRQHHDWRSIARQYFNLYRQMAVR